RAPAAERLNGLLGDRPLVDLIEGQAQGVGRPGVAGAQPELLGVDPVEIAMQDVLGAAARELPGVSAGGWDQPQVVLINERNPAAVGRELRVADAGLLGSDSAGAFGGQVIEKELPGADKEQELAVP